MMYTKSESDITSLATSSPISSPKPPTQVYYVQSPSRDSHEEDKSSTSASATATQAENTPVGFQSPSSFLSLFSRQTRTTATSRVSGSHHGYRRKRRERERVRLLAGQRQAADEVEREREREVYVKWWRDEEGEELSWSCKVFMGVVVLGLVFLVGCSILWGASRPFSPQVFPKDVAVNSFYFGEGSDLTGVPTKILTINCSLRMRVHNPATFFGIHVSCSTINLRYYDLIIASVGAILSTQKKLANGAYKNRRKKVPLYGAGDGFVDTNNAEGIPLILDFEIRSRGEVLGKLVKTKHQRHVICFLKISANTNKIVKIAENS
ncbi:NDR1/HIN1-like protein 1, partial [Bienertia sinuspersici]